MRIEQTAGIIANSWYEDKKLTGENVNITLPSVEWVTQTIKMAGGEVDIPLFGISGALSCNVTTSGAKYGTTIKRAIKPGLHDHEFRWVKKVVKPDGSTKDVGCKAFLQMMSLNIPELGIEKEEAEEQSFDYSVLRMRIYEDGEEVMLIDKKTGKFRVGGIEYNTKMQNYL